MWFQNEPLNHMPIKRPIYINSSRIHLYCTSSTMRSNLAYLDYYTFMCMMMVVYIEISMTLCYNIRSIKLIYHTYIMAYRFLLTLNEIMWKLH